jgi:hypothetical protein
MVEPSVQFLLILVILAYVSVRVQRDKGLSKRQAWPLPT